MTFEQMISAARGIPLNEESPLASAVLSLKRAAQVIARNAQKGSNADDRQKQLLVNALLTSARVALELRVPPGTLEGHTFTLRNGTGPLRAKSHSAELLERIVKFESLPIVTSEPEKARILAIALFSTVIRTLEAYELAFEDLVLPEQAAA